MILQTLGEGISPFERDCRQLLASLPDGPPNNSLEPWRHPIM